MRFSYLNRPPPAHNMNPLDLAPRKRLKRVRRDVALAQDIHVLEQHPRHVQRHVALADDDGLVALRQVRVEFGVLRQAVVPADKLAGRVDALELGLARDAQLPVFGGAVGEYYGIVVPQEAGKGDPAGVRVQLVVDDVAPLVVADRDVADEGEVWRAGYLFKLFLAVLRFRVSGFFLSRSELGSR